MLSTGSLSELVRARPKINIAYVIIAVAALVMLVALLSGPRIRKYAREKNRGGASPAQSGSGQRP
ncbi:MAG TPA: hypothetical protein VE842_04005 [Pyrinomonadaceae bacterium]|jgi:hypothetical protein|nr:hypothetical protein [Pyrinomonadaceae bacterium]